MEREVEGQKEGGREVERGVEGGCRLIIHTEAWFRIIYKEVLYMDRDY